MTIRSWPATVGVARFILTCAARRCVSARPELSSLFGILCASRLSFRAGPTCTSSCQTGVCRSRSVTRGIFTSEAQTRRSWRGSCTRHLSVSAFLRKKDDDAMKAPTRGANCRLPDRVARRRPMARGVFGRGSRPRAPTPVIPQGHVPARTVPHHRCQGPTLALGTRGATVPSGLNPRRLHCARWPFG